MPALTATADGAALLPQSCPAPGFGEVRLRILLAGVCRTDVAAAEGRLGVVPGTVLGHELAAVVDALGDGADPRLRGLRCTVHPRLPDGRFVGVHTDGGFATWLCLPAAQIIVSPVGLDLRRLAFCEPVAAALAVNRANLSPGVRVGMTGHGRIATLTARVLALSGHHLVEDGLPVDVLVHTAAEGLPVLDRVRRGGLIVAKSRPTGPVPVDLRAVVERELRIQGVEYGDFGEALSLLHAGALDVEDLLGPTLPLEDWAEAFSSPETQKIFLAPAADGGD